jgi:AcrR family transcriptional regulator
LLTRAEETLRMSGVDGLSLRELARDAGVSHGAPRRHFKDKRALLDALAVEGFTRLDAVLARANREGGRFADRLSDVAIAYVRFATGHPALLELMFSSKHELDASAELKTAANACFARLEDLVRSGQASGELAAADLQQVGTIVFASLQGITALVNTEMAGDADLDALTVSTVRALLYGLAPRS